MLARNGRSSHLAQDIGQQGLAEIAGQEFARQQCTTQDSLGAVNATRHLTLALESLRSMTQPRSDRHAHSRSRLARKPPSALPCRTSTAALLKRNARPWTNTTFQICAGSTADIFLPAFALNRPVDSTTTGQTSTSAPLSTRLIACSRQLPDMLCLRSRAGTTWDTLERSV